jgi:hypothetical protein
MERADAFLRFGSGWTFDDVKSVDIHTCAYNVIGGSSFIPTPARFKNRSIINIQNFNNERCFAYSVLAGIFPAKNNVCAPCSYEEYMNTLHFDGISFPVKIDQIKKFEKQNEEISINVQHVGPGGNLLSLYASEYRGRKHHINLLLLNESYSVDPEGNETVWDGISEIPSDHTVIHRSHYTLVKNLSALVSARTNRQKKVHACQYCLRCFSGEHVLQNHLESCSKHKPCAIKFPSKFIKK